jgi:hypothetical protein
VTPLSSLRRFTGVPTQPRAGAGEAAVVTPPRPRVHCRTFANFECCWLHLLRTPPSLPSSVALLCHAVILQPKQQPSQGAAPAEQQPGTPLSTQPLPTAAATAAAARLTDKSCSCSCDICGRRSRADGTASASTAGSDSCVGCSHDECSWALNWR